MAIMPAGTTPPAFSGRAASLLKTSRKRYGGETLVVSPMDAIGGGGANGGGGGGGVAGGPSSSGAVGGIVDVYGEGSSAPAVVVVDEPAEGGSSPKTKTKRVFNYSYGSPRGDLLMIENCTDCERVVSSFAWPILTEICLCRAFSGQG